MRSVYIAIALVIVFDILALGMAKRLEWFSQQSASSSKIVRSMKLESEIVDIAVALITKLYATIGYNTGIDDRITKSWQIPRL